MAKTKKEIIAEKRLQLQKKFIGVMKALDDDGQAMLQAIIDEIDALYEISDEGGIETVISEVKKSITDIESRFKDEGDIALLEKDIKGLKQSVVDIKAGIIGGISTWNTNSFQKKLYDFISSDIFKSGIASKTTQAIEFKAAAAITTANAANTTHALNYEVLPGINSAPDEENVIFNTLLKGSTNSRTITWINRVNKDGGAAFIEEGKLKPLKDWEYKEENSVAKKVAVRTKVSTEMLQDFPYMESEIRNLLARDLMDVTDEKLLTGTGGVELDGIITIASAYAGTGLDGTITAANDADAIRAAMLQMRLLNFRPDVVFMNPTEAASLDLLKDTTGRYIKIETDAIIQRVNVVETTEIEAGNFLLMDTEKWIVRVLEDLRLEFGWENDDFSKNLVSVIAEMRLHSYQNSIDNGSAIYESFATIKTALEKV